jgi:hypothetical protein
LGVPLLRPEPGGLVRVALLVIGDPLFLKHAL